MTDHHNQREAYARVIDPEAMKAGPKAPGFILRDRYAEALSKADQIIAMQSQGPEPVAWVPQDWSGKYYLWDEVKPEQIEVARRWSPDFKITPLYAQPDRREVEVLREALTKIKTSTSGAPAQTFLLLNRVASEALSQADAIAREGEA